MFKIVKEGTLIEKHTIYKDICLDCGCIYEFEGSDVATEKTPDGLSYWECPFCHSKVSKKLQDLVSREEIVEKRPKCDCYDSAYRRCNGTRERDICYCNGDTKLCTHYPEKRNKSC